jgi:serine/threonine-protein kinase
MQTLGHYRIDAQLGQGAMGVVYRAVDVRLERTVALKVLRLSLTDAERAEYAARLQQEAKSAARLNHPGIITMYDCGDVDGFAFLAMEFVDGKSLQALTDGGVKLSVGRVQKLADQLFGALAYAHEHGVVHRDIKPANLMLTPDGRLKITDFGIALLPASDLTRTGTLVGSPRHMAPEQIEGKKVDGRADLFAAGIVLYELLTATKPFDGEHLASIAYKILHEPVEDPRSINPDVSEALADVVMRCLEKDPERRFASARDARNALRAAAATAKVAITPAKVPTSEQVVIAPSPTQSAPATARPPLDDQQADSPAKHRIWPWVALAGVTVVVFGALLLLRTETVTPQISIAPPAVSAASVPAAVSLPPAATPALANTDDKAPQKSRAAGKPDVDATTAIIVGSPDMSAEERHKRALAAKAKLKPKPVEVSPPVVQAATSVGDAHAKPVSPHVQAASSQTPVTSEPREDKRTFWERLRGCDENGNCPKAPPRPVHDK